MEVYRFARFKRIIYIMILFLFSVSYANAQEVFTLEKCRELTLKNNNKVENAQLAVEAARQTKKEVFTNYFPNVQAIGMGVWFNRSPIISIDKTIETHLPAPYNYAELEVEIMKDALFGGIMVAQPLFAGGQIIIGNRLAKKGIEASQLQQQMSNDDALLATERYYWQLISLKEKMKTVSQADTLLTRLQKDVKVAVDAGVTYSNDLTRVELEQNRLASNRLKLQNALKALKNMFGKHIGVPADSFDIQPPDFNNIIVPAELPDNEAALHNRPEYQLLEKGVEVAKLQLRMEIGKHLPNIAIGAGYNYMNMGNYASATVDDISLTLKNDAGNRRNAIKSNFGMAFINISVPLTDWWGGAHAIKKRQIEQQIAQNTLEENAGLLSLQMQYIADELDENYHQILLAQKSITAAQENCTLSQNNYNAGVSVLSNLLEAQNLLQQSHDQYIEAITNYYMKLAEWKKVMGK